MAIGEAGVPMEHAAVPAEGVQRQERGNVTNRLHKMVETIVLGMTHSP